MPAFLGVLALTLQTQAVAFVGVNVVRSDRAGIDTAQTVLVQGDRIAWVGPARDAVIPPGAQRVEARGKYLLPGFADMHAHLERSGDLITFVANGVTTVRNMWGTPAHLAWRDSVRVGTLLGPRIVTAGPILDGSPPSESSMTVLTDAALARREVQRQLDAGYDFIKIYNSLPKAVYDTVIAVARERDAAVAGHVPFEVALRGALASGQRSIEHLRGYVAEMMRSDAAVQPGATLKSRSLAWNYIDSTRWAPLVEATVRSGIWNTPTFMVTGELLAPPEQWAALAKRPVLRYLGNSAKLDRAQLPFLKPFTANDFRATQHGLAPQRAFVKALHAGGAKLLAGTDSYLQGFALQLELQELAVAGISPWDVLRIATENAADYFGEAGKWGRVAVGATADLQLVDADPLVSLAALEQRSGVMVRGRWYPQAELQRRLEALAAQPPSDRSR